MLRLLTLIVRSLSKHYIVHFVEFHGRKDFL